jgi:hypothetical protein
MKLRYATVKSFSRLFLHGTVADGRVGRYMKSPCVDQLFTYTGWYTRTKSKGFVANTFVLLIISFLFRHVQYYVVSNTCPPFTWSI